MEDGSVLSYGVYLSERNDRNFEDSERTVKELKDFFFKTLYYWTAAMDLNISSFHVFLDVFSSTS
jgi:hypothetical protein